jgi:hypothetical protein
MKKIVLILFLLSLYCSAQKKMNEKFTLDYIGGVYSNFKTWRENGATGGIELSYKKRRLIYSTNLFMGFGISQNYETKNAYFQAFLETDLLIGTKLNVSNSITIIPQSGIGYLYLTNHFQGEKKYLVGLPVQVKILFFDTKTIAFGLIPRAMINTTQNNYSLNFTLNFKL